MSRRASSTARKFLPTSLHDDLVEVLPHPEFALAIRVALVVMTLPLLIAGDGGALDRVAADVDASPTLGGRHEDVVPCQIFCLIQRQRRAPYRSHPMLTAVAGPITARHLHRVVGSAKL